MTELCKNKNHQTMPMISKLMSMFKEVEEFGSLSVKNFESVMNVDWYSEPLYKWELTQLSDQTYEAVKV